MINKKRMYLLAAVLTMALTGGSGIAEPVRAEEAAASVNIATPEETAQYLGLEVEIDGIEG